jgi:hypothetical protein
LSSGDGEIIVVRSLAESDLGIFKAHRSSTTSKQRAIAMTTPAARELLAPGLYETQGTRMDVICVYAGYGARELRHLGKVGKNWRLGGRKIEAGACSLLDSRDFVLLRSVGRNDGERPIVMTFVGRQRERLLHAGIVASLEGDFRNGVAVVRQGTDDFDALAMAFPPVPAELAVALPIADSDEDAGATLLAGSGGG